ncbi:MAG TPA: hypothetical protein VNV88_05065 [Candidatus Solibacter sp.]|nr:hypothetical protein [Candidatus Solibacter sp.]
MPRRISWSAGLFVLLVLVLGPVCVGQERPYFVTYTHEMEEPGNLEIAMLNVTGKPSAGNRFWGSSVELEYGVTGWWTTELYLDGVSIPNDSTIFTGYRLENRFYPLSRQHWINPVLYVEFENINGADKSMREVVGHDGAADFLDRNSETRKEKKREVELKLILGSNFRGWNISENLIFEKNLINSPWEFGYAVAASRPLKLLASSRPCAFCAEKFAAGIEMNGGLGTRYTAGLHNTSQYLGPTMNWRSPFGATLSFSPQFGLNDYSLPRLFRFGVSYEVDQVLSRMGFSHKDSLHKNQEGR